MSIDGTSSGFRIVQSIFYIKFTEFLYDYTFNEMWIRAAVFYFLLFLNDDCFRQTKFLAYKFFSKWGFTIDWNISASFYEVNYLVRSEMSRMSHSF